MFWPRIEEFVTRLHINLLGDPQVYLADQLLVALPYAKAQALLFYLAVKTDTVHARGALAELLWPHQTEQKALQNLRQALLRLNQMLAPVARDCPFLHVTRRTVQWNGQSSFVCDVHAFRWHIAQAARAPDPLPDLERAMQMYRGDFLHQFVFNDSVEFDTWVTQQREALHVQAVAACIQLYEAYEQHNQPTQAVAAARRLLRLEPWHEATHRALIRLYMAQDRHNDAIQQYHRCVALLHEEFALPPEAATTQLYEAARAHQKQRVSVGAHRTLALENHPAIIERLLAWCQPDVPSHASLEVLALAEQVLHRAGAQRPYDNAAEVCAHLIDAATLLGEPGWQEHYELMLALHTAAVTSAAHAGADTVLRDLETIVRNHAVSLLDTLPVVLTQIEYLIRQQQARAAVRVALPLLAQLGVPLPEHATAAHIEQAWAELQPRIAALPPEALPDLPPMTDALAQAALQLLHVLHIPTFIVAPDLNTLLILTQMRLTLDKGRTAYTALAVASYGVIYGHMQHNPAAGYPFGQIALHCLAADTPIQVVTMTHSKIFSFLAHWREPLRTLIAPMQQIADRSIAAFDIVGAVSMLHTRAFYLAESGSDLTTVAQQLGTDLHLGQRFHVDLRASPTTYTWHYVQALRGQSADPLFLFGSAEEDTTHLSHLRAVGNALLLHVFFTSRMALRYLFGDVAGATADLTQTERYADRLTGLLRMVVFMFYQSLIILANAAQGEAADLQQVRHNQHRLQQWATHAPENFLHKWHLIEAEVCRVAGDPAQAAAQYAQALTLADRHGYTHEAALAARCAAHYYAAQGDSAAAAAHYAQAQARYTAWGAQAIVAQMTDHSALATLGGSEPT